MQNDSFMIFMTQSSRKCDIVIISFYFRKLPITNIIPPKWVCGTAAAPPTGQLPELVQYSTS